MSQDTTRAVASVPVKLKLWGATRCIHRSASCEVFHASVAAGCFSSIHAHSHKNNDFYVAVGHLQVLVHGRSTAVLEGADEPPTEVYEVHAGRHFCVPKGVFHGFLAVTDVELIETYFFDPIDPDDIFRVSTGGFRERAPDPAECAAGVREVQGAAGQGAAP